MPMSRRVVLTTPTKSRCRYFEYIRSHAVSTRLQMEIAKSVRGVVARVWWRGVVVWLYLRLSLVRAPHFSLRWPSVGSGYAHWRPQIAHHYRPSSLHQCSDCHGMSFCLRP